MNRRVRATAYLYAVRKREQGSTTSTRCGWATSTPVRFASKPWHDNRPPIPNRATPAAESVMFQPRIHSPTPAVQTPEPAFHPRPPRDPKFTFRMSLHGEKLMSSEQPKNSPQPSNESAEPQSRLGNGKLAQTPPGEGCSNTNESSTPPKKPIQIVDATYDPNAWAFTSPIRNMSGHDNPPAKRDS